MKVNGRGPKPAEFCLVGEGPGPQEDRTGRCFSGKSGQELERFLDGIDCPDISDVFLTNLYRYYGGKEYRYTTADFERDEPDLVAELLAVKPRIVITMGRPATRWALGDVDIDSVEGLPFYLPEGSRALAALSPDVVVFPLIHVAAGMHNPEMSPYVVRGFREFARFLEGEIEPQHLFADPIPNPVYEEVTNEMQLSELLEGTYRARGVLENHKSVQDGRRDGVVRAPGVLREASPQRITRLSLDTEGWPGLEWSLQFSNEPGTGYLIDARNPVLLARFWGHLYRDRPRLIFHSALHDLAMLRCLGADIDRLTFDDTMVMAYLLQLEPQGLKQGSLRYCNMRMQKYDEIIGDTANELALEYVTWLHDIETMDYKAAQRRELLRLQTTPYLDAKGKERPGRRVTKLPSLPKSPLLKCVVRIMNSDRPAGLWADQIEDIHVAAYKRLGCEMPQATLDYVERSKAVAYGCRDPDATIRLEEHYSKKIDAMGLRDVYNLEISTYPLIDRMQKIGMKPDIAHFDRLSPRLQAEIDRLQHYLEAGTGIDDFNANSGDQVAEYLFDRCGLEPMKMTKGDGHGNGVRGSTNDKILEALEHEHPELAVLSTIRAYREVYKLKNTFSDRVKDFAKRWPHDGRVHPTYRTTRVVTGRLAASEPNILAMPKHGKFAKEFRRGWVVEEGHVMGSWDLSQIELRVAAHLSQDPVMLAIYRGERRNPDGSLIDLHAALAERIFGVLPKLQDDSKHRLPAKAINFGFWMGQTAKGLQVELRKNGIETSEDDAQRWLDDAHALYKGARPYMQERISEAQRTGMVRCMSGRIRYIGGIRSRHARIREEAERFAFSTPIQEGASYVMKTNEAHLWNYILKPLWREGVWVEPLVQIHDDLVLELQENKAKDVSARMVECMTKSFTRLSVPIKTSASIGPNWADMKEFKEAA